MGRRSSPLKMALPISWVAITRLLKKAPLRLLGVDAASKLFLGCGGGPPDTSSFRRTAALLPPRMRRRRRRLLLPMEALRWPRPPPLLPGCASRPYTDSFRTHHVVNQEALQLVLAGDDFVAAVAAGEMLGDDVSAARAAGEIRGGVSAAGGAPPEGCRLGGAIRGGDRLLRDLDAASAGGVSSCSSRLSHSTAGSISSAAFSAANTAFSADSEETHYSAASAASLLPAGPRHSFSSCSSPLSNCCHTGGATTRGTDICTIGEHRSPSIRHDGHCDDLHDEGGNGIVAEIWMSEDPLLDFEASIEELVLCHHLIGRPNQLHTLYCRYIKLNPPALHTTIALAFFRTLQRLDPENDYVSADFDG